MRFWDFLRIDVSSLTDSFRRNSRVILLTMLSVVLVVCAACAVVFFLSLKGGEQFMVPAVEGKDLSVALKAGQRIALVVSRGVIIEKVENYIGQNIDDVRINLQTLFTSNTVPLMSVKEPVLYKFSQEPAGTILEQNPAPDTSITEPIQLTFVVSRGTQNDQLSVPTLTGRSIAEIIAVMEQTDLIFNFTARAPQNDETAGTVVSQLPAGDTQVTKFSVVDAVLAVPVTAPKGFIYGIFQEELPEYPYPFKITIDVISPTGERREYISVRHPGGPLSVPYLLPEGSMLSLSVLNKESGVYSLSPVNPGGQEQQ